MQRKNIFIPIVAVLSLAGAVWANSIFPSTDEFPSSPKTQGTLGYIFDQYFTSTGIAKDGAALAGRSATGYLQGSNCAQSEVWKGIDTSGKAICKGPPLMLAVIHEGTMLVNGTIQPIGTTLREGDRIETDATQTGTIKFYNNPSITPTSIGDSIARLGTSTRVYIDRGDALGTLALVNLEDGLLWGRVLSSTGIDFGGGGLIAGVRGTSIALEKVAGQPLIRMIIPHSQSATDAATLSLANSTGPEVTRPMARSTAMYYDSGAMDPNGGTTSRLYARQYERPISGLYTNTYTDRLGLSKWIRENTAQDITYLDVVGTPAALAELTVTDPDKMHTINSPGFFEAKRALCNNTNIWDTSSNSCIYGYAEYSAVSTTNLHLGNRDILMTSPPKSETLDDGHFCDNDPYQLQGIAGPNQTRIFTYDNLINFNLGGTPSQIATDRAILTATFPGLTTGKTLVINTASCDRTNTEGTAGWNYSNYPHGYYYQGVDGSIELSQNGQAIIYNDPNFLYNLAGKTITIELVGAVPPGKKYVLDLGNGLQYYKGNDNAPNCGDHSCTTGEFTLSQTQAVIKLPYNISPSQFIVGANLNSSGNYVFPISTTIKSIRISN